MSHIIKCEWCDRTIDTHSDEWEEDWLSLEDSERIYDYCPICKAGIKVALVNRPDDMNKITEMYRNYDKLYSEVQKWVVGQSTDAHLRCLLREISLERQMFFRNYRKISGSEKQ